METTNISQRVAAISGAASGIGLALATLYARRGIRVIAGYYPDDPHDPTVAAAQVEEAGGDALWLPLNVADTASVDTFIEEMNDDRWNEMLNVDLTGVMRCFRAATPRLISGGSLVAISSIAGGVYGWQEHAHYAAAKAAVPGICRSLAVELAPRGIRCNAVIPGLIETPQSLDKQNSLGPEGLAKAARSIPLGRVGCPDDIARVVAFLTSDESRYLTGQSLIVDGGLTVRWPD